MDTIDIIEHRPTRSTAIWTPDMLRTAEWAADAGRLAMAADLWESLIVADDRLKSALDTRTDGLLGRALSFEGRSARAVNALDAKEDWWRIFPEDQLKPLHHWGLGLGVGIGHMTWGVHEGRDVPRLSVKHPRNLRWCWRERGWFFRLAAGPASDLAYTEVRITPGDGNWVLYTPYGAAQPWTFGIYRSLSRWALLKQFAIDDWADYSDRKGQGVLVAKGIKGNRDERAKIKDELRKLAGNGAIALPDGADLSLLEATANTWATFKAQIEMADLAAAVAVLGQNMSTLAGATGAQGAASLQGDVKLSKTKVDAETLSTFAHDQVLEHWAAANFGDMTRAPWPIWDTKPVEDKKAEAAVEQMTAQATATLVQAKVITLDEARARHGYAPVPPPAPAEPSPAAAQDGAAPTPPPSATAVTTEQPPIYGYHLEFGVVSVNEARAQLGLEAREGYDELGVNTGAVADLADAEDPNNDATKKP